jgi:putative (di)nucleoside polyphosphate hydrolase
MSTKIPKELEEQIASLREKGEMPYRQGVVGIIVDSENNFLIVQMCAYQDNQWRFCGGGVEGEEDLHKALIRELEEELGTTSFEILKESSIVNRFEWPTEVTVRRYLTDGKFFRGQEQKQFLAKFTGKKEDFKVDPGELKRVKWVKREELEAHFIFENQWKQAEETLKELLQ